MLPLFLLSAGILLAQGSAAQTSLDGSETDVPTGYSEIKDDGTVAQTDAAGRSVTTAKKYDQQGDAANIDGQLENDKAALNVGGKPPNAAEWKRAQASKDLSEIIAGRLDSSGLDTSDVTENVALPRALNQFQRAWETSDPEHGVYVAKACMNCVYKMQTRELMVSTIQLPKIEMIAGFDLGDQSTFAAEIRNDYTLVIKPLAYNVDTNLNIYTESGMVYPFYVRSLPFQSNLIPDLLVRIEDNGLVPGKFKMKTLADVSEAMKKVVPEQVQSKVEISELLENFKTPEQSEEDFIRTIEFDPASLTGFEDYRVSGSKDRKLTTKIVFRDKAFTYIQWDDWDNFDHITAYVVKHGIDTLVNTRVRGKTMIIESTADLISLKNRDSYLCLEWRGA